MTQPYERFDAWQLCHQLVLEVYRITAEWPKSEMFGLTAQARRAATSTSLNFVEGAAKRGKAEFARYLDIGNGSLSELGYILRLAKELDYLAPATWEQAEDKRARAARSLWGLYRALRREQR